MDRSKIRFWLLPAYCVITLSAIAIITSISNSFFWADDFGNMAAFSHTFGSFTNYQVNAGRPILNFFFYLMGVSFGTGSSIPYLIVAGIICLAGIFLIFNNLIKLEILNHSMSIWLVSILFGTLFLWPILLWSTNITHGASIFLLGLSIHMYRKSMEIDLDSLAYKLLEGLCLGTIILCNPLYIGIVLIFSLTSIISSYQNFKSNMFRQYIYLIFYLSTGILFPLAYFILISQPQQKKNPAYSNTSLENIVPNLNFYTNGLASSVWAYIFLGVIILLFLVARPKVIDLVFCAAGMSVLGPVLIQSQQKVLNYMVLPTILFGVVLVRSLRIVLESKTPLIFGIYSCMAVIPLFIFVQTADMRAWHINPGIGSEAKSILVKVGQLVPINSKLCVFAENIDQENFIVASLSGSSGFTNSPVYSPDTQFDRYSNCKNDSSRVKILINRDISGNFNPTRLP